MQVNIEDLDKYKEFIASINSVPLEQIEWFYGGYLLRFPKEQIDEFKFVGLTNACFLDYVGLSPDGERTMDCSVTKVADRPDDDEPITPEWVFANFPSMGPQYSARQLHDLPQLEWHNRFERFVLYKNPQPQIKTRGDCRRLCAALGRPLQERG